MGVKYPKSSSLLIVSAIVGNELKAITPPEIADALAKPDLGWG